MSDETRRMTVEVPTASNSVLNGEKIIAIEKAVKALDEKLDFMIGKLDAARELALEEARKRAASDEKLDRSLERIHDKIMAVARIQGEQAETIAETHALAKAAVDGVESMNRLIDEIKKSQGAQSAPIAQPAE